jgi:hypothetical protein
MAYNKKVDVVPTPPGGSLDDRLALHIREISELIAVIDRLRTTIESLQYLHGHDNDERLTNAETFACQNANLSSPGGSGALMHHAAHTTTLKTPKPGSLLVFAYLSSIMASKWLL